MQRSILMTAMLATLVLPVRVQAQALQPILGSRVDVRMRTGGRIRGELLAATVDTVWVLGENGVVPLPLSAVRQVRIPYSGGVSASTVLKWGAVAGIVTGAALTAACSSVADGCGSVFSATLVTWSVITGISALLAGRGSAAKIGPLGFGRLPAYARFPQGVPQAYWERRERHVAGETIQR